MPAKPFVIAKPCLVPVPSLHFRGCASRSAPKALPPLSPRREIRRDHIQAHVQAMPSALHRFVGSDEARNRCSAHSLLSHVASFADGSSTDSIPSIWVLISSPNLIVIDSTMLSLKHYTQHCPERLRLKLVETELIPHLAITLNRLPLSLTDSEDIPITLAHLLISLLLTDPRALRHPRNRTIP
ncbi:hypothetical protein BLNAU_5364 [Blattamonas nauphoetae]|uniref:Uncharacterized protein n=1 Tax=Blattamonas nauphoetae TaxID=2049346 RepID=A0ABQ9Y785_9EUKA|nr:hypothetical protein BLNAU_5364 [Blattamonas nauphoetae]